MNIYCECKKELEIKKDINTEIHVFGHICKSHTEQDDSLLAAMQARIDKLGTLQTIAEDVNTWLIKNKLGGTAHQRSLAEALYALKGDK